MKLPSQNFHKDKSRAVSECFILRIKPLERIILEEDSSKRLGLILVFNLLHVNTMKLCALCFTGNECSKHEVAITRSRISCQLPRNVQTKMEFTSPDRRGMDLNLARGLFQEGECRRLK